ncbi:MAG: class I SAM-dependent methyltransferase [Acidimicrobiia bacterium]
MLDPEGVGLEIGPLNQPFMPKREGFRVQIVDLVGTEELRDLYRSHGVDVATIEPVDHVVGDRTLSEALGDLGPVDWIVAGHVLEHIPDPVTFLRTIESILTPTGRLVMALPDKRYCVDHYGELTTAGHLVDAHLQQRTTPTPGQIVDHMARSASVDGSISWGKGAPGVPIPLFDRDLIRTNYEAALGGETFGGSIHLWRFTPESFRLLIEDLGVLGLTRLTIIEELDTLGAEFFVSLGIPDSTPAQGDRRVLLERSRTSHAL